MLFCFGYYGDSLGVPVGLHHERGKVFGEEVTAADEPDEEDTGEDKWFGSRLLELVKTCLGSESYHSHCQHEGVDIVYEVNAQSRDTHRCAEAVEVY